ncbi:MAG TPA: hypothetical protein VGC74_18110 [Stenotrophomonas sp.]|jgi:TPR repeat protein
MNKKLLTYVVVGGISIVAIVAFLKSPSQVKIGSSTAEPTKAQVPRAEVRRPQSSALKNPLPQVGAPLHLIEGDLKRRALAGDGSAACRLALEYQRCVVAEQRVEHVAEVMAGSDPNEAPRRVALPLDPNGFYVDVAHCADVNAPPAIEIAALWRRAADSGNPAAMTNYAVGNAFSIGNILDTIDELQVYKQRAGTLAHKAAMSGDGGALLSLAAAYSPENQVGPRSFLAQAVGTDLQQSLTLYKAAYISLDSSGANGDIGSFVAERIAALSKRASASQLSDADTASRKMAGEMGKVRYPSSRAIAYLRLGRTAEPAVTDCGD